ncbi:hypothetical protein E8E14_003572 [Neopestalotiopsis sp. 37M]|nr:hypothetical protein E8E14_003572 [Neopestalotiopsis sp. 37M]
MAIDSTVSSSTEEYDLIIVGAGISGINCAYRLQTRLPNLKFAILENRSDIGGTWDLWKYPGIRSDSDLHTFGFSWQPWPHESPIAEGPLIISYIKECIATHGLDKYINLRHKVLSADWSSKTSRWSLAVDHDGKKKHYTAKFTVLGAGYYDFNQPLKVEIPGLNRFQGKVIHPQFWPEDYDYSNKKVVVIGSGATAITLLPSMAKKAAHITMLQRSPSYIIAAAQKSQGLIPRAWWPRWLLAYVERWWYMAYAQFSVFLCEWFPKLVRKFLLKETHKLLPTRIALDPHFNPRYNPWDQRVCFAPDGDFYTCLHTPKADVVTSRIRTVTEDGIDLETGGKLEADLIVTATGLRMQWGGGIPLSVDGGRVDVGGRFIWNGAMIQDMPNLFFMVGYTNASWTMGADDTAFIITRLLKHMESQGLHVGVPRVAPRDARTMVKKPYWHLNSTYAKEAEVRNPKYGDRGPWRARNKVIHDYLHARFGNYTQGLHFVN